MAFFLNLLALSTILKQSLSHEDPEVGMGVQDYTTGLKLNPGMSEAVFPELHVVVISWVMEST